MAWRKSAEPDLRNKSIISSSVSQSNNPSEMTRAAERGGHFGNAASNLRIVTIACTSRLDRGFGDVDAEIARRTIFYQLSGHDAGSAAQLDDALVGEVGAQQLRRDRDAKAQ